MRSDIPLEALGFSEDLACIRVTQSDALESDNRAGPCSSMDDSIVSTMGAIEAYRTSLSLSNTFNKCDAALEQNDEASVLVARLNRSIQTGVNREARDDFWNAQLTLSQQSVMFLVRYTYLAMAIIAQEDTEPSESVTFVVRGVMISSI